MDRQVVFSRAELRIILDQFANTENWHYLEDAEADVQQKVEELLNAAE